MNKMDSFLSLDELYLSFPNQARFNSARKDRPKEKGCDVLDEASDGDNNSYDKDENFKQFQTGPAFLPADYIVTDEEDDCYADSKLPSIRPAYGKQKNGLLKRSRNRTEFSCIDVDDFSVSDKPLMVNAGKDIKENTFSRNNSLPASLRRQNCLSEEIWDNNNLAKNRQTEKTSLDSVSPSNAFVNRPRPLSLGNFTEVHGRVQQQASFNSQVNSKPGRSASDLPERFSKFLEMEFSIMKGEKINSIQRYRPRSESMPIQRSGPPYQNTRSPSLSELGKPDNTNTKERSKCSVSVESLVRPHGSCRTPNGEKREYSSVAVHVNKESASDSPNSSRASRFRFDRTHSSPSEQKPKDGSPRISPKEFGDRHLFSPSASRELPLDLPEKFTKFIEMEFSIPKGENASSTQKQKYSVAGESGSPREKESFLPSPKEVRKSQNPSPLLQRRGKLEENSFRQNCRKDKAYEL